MRVDECLPVTQAELLLDQESPPEARAELLLDEEPPPVVPAEVLPGEESPPVTGAELPPAEKSAPVNEAKLASGEELAEDSQGDPSDEVGAAGVDGDAAILLLDRDARTEDGELPDPIAAPPHATPAAAVGSGDTPPGGSDTLHLPSALPVRFHSLVEIELFRAEAEVLGSGRPESRSGDDLGAGLFDVDGRSGVDLSGDHAAIDCTTAECGPASDDGPSAPLVMPDCGPRESTETVDTALVDESARVDDFVSRLVDLPDMGPRESPSPSDSPPMAEAMAEAVAEAHTNPSGEPHAAEPPLCDTAGTLVDEPDADAHSSDARGAPSDFERSVWRNLERESLAQQYARTLHRVIEKLPDGPPAAVLVVGAEREPHVSQVLTHMAVLLVQREAGRVLLVDAGLPDKTLSHRFQVGDKPGLAEACRGERDWRDLLVPGDHPQLSVLPAGIVPVDGGLPCGKLKCLVDEWKEDSQIVLVDAGGADGPLAGALTGACDSVYLLVRLGQTPRTQARKAAKRLRVLKGGLQGCIVTNCPD